MAGAARRKTERIGALAAVVVIVAAATLATSPSAARARPRLIRLPYHTAPPRQGGPLPMSDPWSSDPRIITGDVDGDGLPERILAKGESVLAERPAGRYTDVLCEHALPVLYTERDLAFQQQVQQRGIAWFPPAIALGQILDADGDGAQELILTAATAHLEHFALLLLDMVSGELDLEVELPRGADRRQDGIWSGRWTPVGVLPAGQAGPHAAAVLACWVHRDATGRGLMAVDLVDGRTLWRWESGAQMSPDGLWVGDLEGDGAWEIVCATGAPDNLNGQRLGGRSDDEALLLRFDAHGRQQWERRLGEAYQFGHLAVADLDGDGVREVITSTSSSIPGRANHLEVHSPDGGRLWSRDIPDKGHYQMAAAAAPDGGRVFCRTRWGLQVFRWHDGELALLHERTFSVPQEILRVADALPAAGPELVAGRAGGLVIYDRDLRPLLDCDTGFRVISRAFFWRPEPDRLFLVTQGEKRLCAEILPTPPLARAAPLLATGGGAALLGLAGIALRRRRRRHVDPRPPREILVHLLLDLCEDDGGGLQALGGLRRLVALGAGGDNPDAGRARGEGADQEAAATWARLWPQVRDADIPVIRDVLARAIEVDYEPQLARATLDQLARLTRACERRDGGRAAEALGRVASGLRQLRERLQHYFSDDLPRRLEAILAMLAPELARAEVRVRREGPGAGDVPPCLIDATDLRAILDNLVGNAIRALREAPRRELLLRVVLAGAGVQLEVTDSGPGVSASVRQGIFADGQSMRRGGGFGLAHSRKLARRWGGDLELLESGPGEGVTFRLSLATAPEALVAASAAADRPVAAGARSLLPRLLAEVRQLHHGGQALARSLGRLVNSLAACRATFVQVEALPPSVPVWHRRFKQHDLPRLLEVLDLADRVADNLDRPALSGRIRENLLALAALLDELGGAGWPVAAAADAYPELQRRLRAIVGDFDLLHDRLKDHCSCDLGRVLSRFGAGAVPAVRVLVPEGELTRALAAATGGIGSGDHATVALGISCTLEANRVRLLMQCPGGPAPPYQVAEQARRWLAPWGGDAAVLPAAASRPPRLSITVPLR